MASLADIPDAFLAPGLIKPFIEWLKLLPATKETKHELLALWNQHTHGTYTHADIHEIDSTGFLLHG
jgi:hypothetical protein